MHIDRDDDLLDGLTYLHKLRRAGLGMRFELATLRPIVSLVVVVDVAEQKARFAAVNDQPNVAVYPH
jgi:hypothetical protein